jgi:hypothetical protein
MDGTRWAVLQQRPRASGGGFVKTVMKQRITRKAINYLNSSESILLPRGAAGDRNEHALAHSYVGRQFIKKCSAPGQKHFLYKEIVTLNVTFRLQPNGSDINPLHHAIMKYSKREIVRRKEGKKCINLLHITNQF